MATLPHAHVGIIIPRKGTFSYALQHALQQLQVPWNDYVGATLPPTPPQELLGAYIRFQEHPTFDTLLAFASRLHHHQHPQSPHVSDLKSSLKKAIIATGTLHLPDLLSSSRSAWHFLQFFPLLPATHSFQFFFHAFQDILTQLGFSPSALQEHHSVGNATFLTTSQMALKWLKANILTPHSCQQSTEAFAPLTMTTPQNALQQPFTHLWIAHLCREAVPTTDNERYLNSQKAQALNHPIYHPHTADLATPHTLYHHPLAQLIRMTTQGISLSYHTQEDRNTTLTPHPIFTQTAHLTQQTIQDFDHLPPPTAYTPQTDITHAYQQRRQHAFTPYLYFNTSDHLRPPRLTVKNYEEALLTPSKIWYTHILHISLPQSLSLSKLSPLLKGSWMHQWLQLPSGTHAPPPSFEEWITHIHKNAKRTLRAQLHPLWLWRHQNVLGDLIKAVTHLQHLPDTYTALNSEYSIKVPIDKPDCPLHTYTLSGTIDLLYTHPERTLILDLKTGKSSLDLNTGKGLQLYLYAFALSLTGAPHITLSLLKPHAIPRPIVFNDEELLPIARRLSAILKGQLGQSPKEIQSHNPYSTPQPIATIPLKISHLQIPYKQQHTFSS